MMGWRRYPVSALLSRLSPATIALTGSGRLLILNFHRINYPNSSFALDRDVISATPEAFASQMRFCKANFDVISFQELSDCLDSGAVLPKRPLIITFDDGYEDNYRHAYPLLKMHGLSAMFFVATSYVGSERWFWWDEVAASVNGHSGASLTIEVGGVRMQLDTSTPASRLTSIRTLLRALKGVSNEVRLKAVEDLFGDRGRMAAASMPRQIMTWAEVAELSRNGMEVGSHSVTHPILSNVDDVQLQTEVVASKQTLETHLKREVSVFSYPVGGPSAFDARVVGAVRAAGYRFAVSYINGANSVDGSLDRFTMKRLHVDGLTDNEFRSRLSLPALR